MSELKQKYCDCEVGKCSGEWSQDVCVFRFMEKNHTPNSAIKKLIDKTWAEYQGEVPKVVIDFMDKLE